MERAIHITSLKNISYFKKGRYQRVYWGAEFCQNLIPDIEDTWQVLRFAKKNNLGFTFVTPFVTEHGLERLKKIFEWLGKQKIKTEIVVNDWGILELLHTRYKGVFDIALGRLLARQHRDPLIKHILEKQRAFAVKSKDGKISIVVHLPPPKIYQSGVRRSYINSSTLQGFLARFGAGRIELNNIIQGLELDGIRFHKSLYTPFVNISTTRFCPMENKFQKIRRINACFRECQRYYDILRNKTFPKVIYKRGNTIFYKNPVNLRSVKQSGIDRIVFQPELPF